MGLYETPMPLVNILDGEEAPGPAEGVAHGREIVGDPARGGVRCVADLGPCDIDEGGCGPIRTARYTEQAVAAVRAEVPCRPDSSRLP